MSLAETKKVLIVDDSKMMRVLLARVVKSDPSFEVAGEADNGQAAIDLLSETSIDLVLLDIEMPVMNGVEALRQIRLKHDIKVIVVSSLAQVASVQAAEVKQLGVDGIVDKPGGALDPSLAATKGQELISLMRKVTGLN